MTDCKIRGKTLRKLIFRLFSAATILTVAGLPISSVLAQVKPFAEGPCARQYETVLDNDSPQILLAARDASLITMLENCDYAETVSGTQPAIWERISDNAFIRVGLNYEENVFEVDVFLVDIDNQRFIFTPEIDFTAEQQEKIMQMEEALWNRLQELQQDHNDPGQPSTV